MARVTIEDCIDKVKDRFELVAVAAQRAKNIAAGEALTIERKQEKDTVLSLREIEQETVSVDDLRDALVKSFQKERELEEEPEMTDEDKLEARISEEISPDAAKELMDLESEAGLPEEEEVAKKAAASEDYSFEEDNLEVDD